MEYLVLSFFTAVGKMWVISRFIGFVRMIRLARWFDLFFVFVLPILFFGTFAGMVTAVLSGLWFTLLTAFFGVFVRR